jgi:hypothetical protein
MTILFAASAVEAFAELPERTKRKAARSIELLTQHPRMYPARCAASCVDTGILPLADI